MPEALQQGFLVASMEPPWSAEHAEAADREGWNIWNCSGSDYGVWQICRNDEVEPWADGFMPPQLSDDSEAWDIVARGTEVHHLAARAFIEAHGSSMHIEELRQASERAREVAGVQR